MGKKSKKSYVKTNSLLLLMVQLTVILPVIQQFFLKTNLYSFFRFGLYITAAITFFVVLLKRKSIGKSSFLSFYCLMIYISGIFLLQVSLYTGNLEVGRLLEFSMPFMILLIGYKSKLSKSDLNKTIQLYMWLVTILGLYIIFFYGNGFEITEQYFFGNKNQVGPFIASVSLLSFMSLAEYENNAGLFKKATLAILFILNTSVLLTLRNRSGLVALALCLTVYFISKIKYKKIKVKWLLYSFFLFVSVSVLMRLGAFDKINSMIYQSFFLNYDTTNIDSLSAGRTAVFGDVLGFLITFPFFGEITTNSNINGIPHNYLLNLWLNYGVIGSLPMTIFYFYLWFKVSWQTIFKKNKDVSIYIFLLMLTISLFEFTFPFGPLTTVSFAWFLMGHNLSKEPEAQ